MWSISMLEIQYERAKKPKKKQVLLKFDQQALRLQLQGRTNPSISFGKTLSCLPLPTLCYWSTVWITIAIWALALTCVIAAQEWQQAVLMQHQNCSLLPWVVGFQRCVTHHSHSVIQLYCEEKWQSNANRGINSAKRWDILLPCTISICSQYSLISFQGHRGTGANTQTDLWGDQIWRQSVNEDWATGGWIY